MLPLFFVGDVMRFLRLRTEPWLLAMIPASLGLGFLVAMIVAGVNRDKTDSRYRVMARQAMTDGDYGRAKMLYSRLINDSYPTDPKDLFDWCDLLAREGDTIGASAVLDQLAPDDGTGYQEAHRSQAISTVRMLASIESAENRSELAEPLLRQLLHHLTRSGPGNPLQLCDLWAAYHFGTGQDKQGLRKLIESASHDPGRWLSTAAACVRLGDENQRDRCYRNAETHYTKKLETDPLDHQSRVGLAKVFVETNRIDAASSLLEKGLRVASRPELRRAAADLRLFQIDQLAEPLAKDFEKFTSLLAQAFELDPTNPHAFGRLMAAFSVSDSGDRRARLRERLQSMVAQGDSISFAHFSLGALYWHDEDLENAIWHTEKALELDSGLMDVANNAAWLEAQREGGDLQRALSLIELAIGKNPKLLEYRDTKAMILVKLKLWDQALIELENLLPASTGEKRTDLHKTIAAVYEELGKHTLAKLHLEQTKTLKSEQ